MFLSNTILVANIDIGVNTELLTTPIQKSSDQHGVIAACCQVGEPASCMFVFNVCSHVLHSSCNILSPLLTCQSHRNSECSPSNTSVQCLREEKPFSGPPTAASFSDALLVWASPACLLVLYRVCWDIRAHSLSLGGKLEHSEYGLYVCHRQTEGFTEATYHFIMCPAQLVLPVLFSFANKSKLLTETYLDWVFSESRLRSLSLYTAASESSHSLKR